MKSWAHPGFEEILREIREDEELLVAMAQSEAAFRRWATADGPVDFLSSFDDAILAPSVLRGLMGLRGRLSRNTGRSKDTVELARKPLRRALLAYANPKLPRSVEDRQRIAKLETARFLALLDSRGTGGKFAVCFARRTDEQGLVKSRPTTSSLSSRASERAQQRLRRRLGGAPGRRGRPRRKE